MLDNENDSGVGVLDEIKAISAQLGLGFGLSLAIIIILIIY